MKQLLGLGASHRSVGSNSSDTLILKNDFVPESAPTFFSKSPYLESENDVGLGCAYLNSEK